MSAILVLLDCFKGAFIKKEKYSFHSFNNVIIVQISVLTSSSTLHEHILKLVSCKKVEGTKIFMALMCKVSY